MSYLIRVHLPDTPGSLGMLAETLGLVDANIQSVDVVHVFPDGTAVDDIVVTLPTGVLPDSIISAAQQIDGVSIDSLRPFSGSVTRNGQIEMLAVIARSKNNIAAAMEELVKVMPKSMTCGWCIVASTTGGLHRVASSPAAPEDDGSHPEYHLDSARIVDADTEEWIPSHWGLLDSSLAATPIPGTDMILVIGRPGGPDFIAGEVEHLGHVGEILGAILT